MPPTSAGSSSSNDVPAWIKTTTGYWVDGVSSDNEFVSAIQFLIKEGIIVYHNQLPTLKKQLSINTSENNDWFFSYPKRKLRKMITKGDYKKALAFGNSIEDKFSEDPGFLFIMGTIYYFLENAIMQFIILIGLFNTMTLTLKSLKKCTLCN